MHKWLKYNNKGTKVHNKSNQKRQQKFAQKLNINVPNNI